MSSVTLGLGPNWKQFALLVLINAFVGGMVGIERTVVPLTRSLYASPSSDWLGGEIKNRTCFAIKA